LPTLFWQVRILAMKAAPAGLNNSIAFGIIKQRWAKRLSSLIMQSALVKPYRIIPARFLRYFTQVIGKQNEYTEPNLSTNQF